MKKTIICMILFLAVLSLNKAKAQVRVNVNFNIGAQPVWGPVGYDYVEYYYLPDIDVYYHVPARQFVYLSGGRWIFASSLPVAYRSYNLYSGYKVVINEPRAYSHYKQHRVKYASYKGNRGQVIIRNAKGKGHDRHPHKAGSGHRKDRH